MSLSKFKNLLLVFLGLVIFTCGYTFCANMGSIFYEYDYVWKLIVYDILPAIIWFGFLIYLFFMFAKIRFKKIRLQDCISFLAVFVIVYSSINLFFDILYFCFNLMLFYLGDGILNLTILILGIISLCNVKVASFKKKIVSNLLLASYILLILNPIRSIIESIIFMFSYLIVSRICLVLIDFGYVAMFVLGAIISKTIFKLYDVNEVELYANNSIKEQQYPLTSEMRLRKRNLMLFDTFFGTIGLHCFVGKGTFSKGIIRLSLTLVAGYYSLLGYLGNNIFLYAVSGAIVTWNLVLLTIDLYDIICDRFEIIKR